MAIVISEKEIKREVIKELKTYRALRVRMINKKELEINGYNQLFTCLRKDEREEKQNEIKYLQIERTLQEALDEKEREIIEKKYLQPSIPKDVTLYEDMGLKRDPYYMYKKQAIEQIAISLGIA